MTKDAILEGSSQQANKEAINKRNEQGPKHLNFLLVFSKDEAQADGLIPKDGLFFLEI